MPTAVLQWDEKTAPFGILSREGLEFRLRELATECVERPILAMLTMHDGSVVHVGLGREESIVLLYPPQSDDGRTDEWISIGGETRSGATDFHLLGEHHSEFENRCLIPSEDAIQAVGSLFETGTRPDSLRWESNSF